MTDEHVTRYMPVKVPSCPTNAKPERERECMEVKTARAAIYSEYWGDGPLGMGLVKLRTSNFAGTFT